MYHYIKYITKHDLYHRIEQHKNNMHHSFGSLYLCVFVQINVFSSTLSLYFSPTACASNFTATTSYKLIISALSCTKPTCLAWRYSTTRTRPPSTPSPPRYSPSCPPHRCDRPNTSSRFPALLQQQEQQQWEPSPQQHLSSL